MFTLPALDGLLISSATGNIFRIRTTRALFPEWRPQRRPIAVVPSRLADALMQTFRQMAR